MDSLAKVGKEGADKKVHEQIKTHWDQEGNLEIREDIEEAAPEPAAKPAAESSLSKTLKLIKEEPDWDQLKQMLVSKIDKMDLPE